MKKTIKKIPFLKNLVERLDNNNTRREWVKEKLHNLQKGSKLLDAGCGSQQFRMFCDHLDYRGQDFGEYVSDEKVMLGAEDGGLGAGSGYKYGSLDYVGDIWKIAEEDSFFDVILCTEVFEHILYPIESIKEFARLLKPGGRLILTAPNASLRHMDPYFYYTGFSDRWYEEILKVHGFEIQEIKPVGDYYSWLAVEMARTGMTHSLFAKVILLPEFLYFFYKNAPKTSVDTFCMGYHVLARKV